MASMATLSTMDLTNTAALLSNAEVCTGSWAAADQTLEYMPLVRSIARKMRRTLPQHIELDDLISAGTLGLLDALAKYKTGHDTSFKSYAQFRIRGAILDSLRDLDWGSRELRRRGREISDAASRLAHQFGRTPEEAEIAVELGLSLADLRECLGDIRQLEIDSLHAERGEDSDEEAISYLADPSEPGALFHCLRGELQHHLADAIEALPERERLVITLYYHEELTLKEIGAVLGVVESRVSQLRSSAVRRLRTALENCR